VLNLENPPLIKMVSQQFLIVENTLLGLGLVMMESRGQVVMAATKNTLLIVKRMALPI